MKSQKQKNILHKKRMNNKSPNSSLCFSIVYILPIDLRPHVGDNNAMLPFYFALYSLCFFLTWILTPFQTPKNDYLMQ